MKRILSPVVLSGVLFLVAACSTSSPMPGLVFTTGSVHHEDRANGSKIGSGNLLRRGESCSSSIQLINYLFYGFGHSVEKAAASAGIKKIGVIDHSSMNIPLFLYYQDCTIVWGE
jgi:hypothetical protein